MIANYEKILADLNTKKRRDLNIQLTDEQYNSLCHYAFKAGLQDPAELLESFTADLSGWHSNGSDEELHADQWYDRTFSYMGGESSFLSYLYDNKMTEWNLEEILETEAHQPNEIYDEYKNNDGTVEQELYKDIYNYDWYQDYLDSVYQEDAQKKEDCVNIIRELMQQKTSKAIIWNR